MSEETLKKESGTARVERLILCLLALAGAILASACDADDEATAPTPSRQVPHSAPPSDDNTVAEIVIWQPPVTIGLGETGLLHAWANAASVGRIKPGSPILWRSTDTTIARLAPADGGGYPEVDFWTSLHGVKKGMTTIRAAIGDKSVAVTITVGEPATSIEISPTAASLSATLCQNIHLGLSLHDAFGNRLAGRQAVWTSSDPGVVSLGDGLVWALDSGTATITASTGLISANAVITVEGHRLGRHACDDED
jgi:uncharacterized protein YjdB